MTALRSADVSTPTSGTPHSGAGVDSVFRRVVYPHAGQYEVRPT